MQIAPSVTFHDMPTIPGLEADVLDHVRKLEQFFDGIIACRVVVSGPHRHHKGGLYSVRIDLTVPGEMIVIDRDPSLDHAHQDAHVAVRDSFQAARRRLQDYVRLMRGFVKHHESPSITPEARESAPRPAG